MSSPYSEDERAVARIPRGWCSERLPITGRGARRHVAASALMPFSSGRALPSKWDDAERWITSPVSVGSGPAYNRAQRRAQSKSGPLGPGALTSYGSFNNNNSSSNNGYGYGYSYSPVLGMGVIGGGRWRNSVMIESPGSGRVRAGDGGCVEGEALGRRSCPGDPDWLDSWSGPPSPSHIGNSGEENIRSMDYADNHVDNGGVGVDRAVSRRDMATQMFPESESSSSTTSVATTPRSSISTTSPCHLLKEAMNKIVNQSPESEVRDVQIDKQTSTDQRSNSDKDRMAMIPIVDADKDISKEEAKISAWENLQKAKAEAAIQKLEMELEKKRSSSMEKIVEKLRRAEIKAQKMRSSLASGDDQIQSRAVLRSTSKLPSFCRKLRLLSTTRNCSTCYPF